MHFITLDLFPLFVLNKNSPLTHRSAMVMEIMNQQKSVLHKLCSVTFPALWSACCRGERGLCKHVKATLPGFTLDAIREEQEQEAASEPTTQPHAGTHIING